MKRYTRFFKILVINVFLFLLLFLCLEIFYAYKWGIRLDNIEQYFLSVFKPISAEKYFEALYKGNHPDNTFSYLFRPDVNVASQKRPIVVMGCSFAWGERLEENETLSYLLAEQTKRPVYNRSGRGWGLAQLLFQLKEGFLFNQIKNEPEAIVYVFIKEQINRIDKFKIEPLCSDLQPKYKYTDGQLIKESPKFLDTSVTVQNYMYYYNYIFNNVSSEEIKQYFIESKKEMNKKWANTKFIIVLFPTCNEDFTLLNDNIWNELQQSGFIVLNANKISGLNLEESKYKIPVDDFHPTKEVWEKFVPNFLKEMNL